MSEHQDDTFTLAYWQSRLAQAQRDVQAAIRRRDGISRIVEGMKLLEPNETEVEVVFVAPESGLNETDEVEGPDEIRPPRLSGRPAARELFERSPDSDVAQTWVISEMKRLGWIDPDLKTPDAAIRVMLRRMWKDGELTKVRDGVYRLARPPESSPVQTHLDEGGGIDE